MKKKTTKIKGLKNINLLHELPFYDELDIYKMSKAFRHYARSYEVEIVDSKGPLAQLEASKSSINDLSEEVLDEIKGFKYQITVKALLEQTQESVKRKWRHRSCSCLFQFYH